jgi:hypothetical protein
VSAQRYAISASVDAAAARRPVCNSFHKYRKSRVYVRQRTSAHCAQIYYSKQRRVFGAVRGKIDSIGLMLPISLLVLVQDKT